MRRVRSVAKRTLDTLAAAVGPHRWSKGPSRLWIVMYHRVLPLSDPRAGCEEPGMMVTPETLARHIEWVQGIMPIVRLERWIKHVRAGEQVPQRACALTFDDGWRDNYEYAYPVLRRYGVSATIFVVPGRMGRAKPFWPNRLASVLSLVAHDPATSVALDVLRSCLPSPWPTTFSADHQAAVIAAAKRFSDAEIDACLDRAEAALGVRHEHDAGLMSWQNLREGLESGLIDIGSHGYSHRRLDNSVSAQDLQREVRDSKAMIEANLGTRPSLFCYPNGDFVPMVKQCVSEVYDGALTTLRGLNTAQADLMALKRIAVHESISESRTKFLARLSAWL
jgi:peptidoglycan/xylan/chitin deacetylase (PgdA/CDA1 family)